MKKLFVFLLAAIVLGVPFGSGSVQASSAPETITVLSAPLQFDIGGTVYAPPLEQAGFLYQDRTYVPFRFAAYTLGYQVHWNKDTYTVTVTKPSQDEMRMIDASRKLHQRADNALKAVDVSDLRRLNISVLFRDVNYVILGEAKEPPANMRSFIYKSTLYVPLRYFAESLDLQVNWNQKYYSVSAVPPEEIPGQAAPDAGKRDPKDEAGTNPVPGAPVIPGGGGSVSPKVSEESIKNETENALYELRASCANRLASLYTDYLNAKTEEAKSALIDKGYTVLADCDMKFEAIVSAAAAKLTQNGYSTEVIATYRAAYEEEKAAALEMLG